MQSSKRLALDQHQIEKFIQEKLDNQRSNSLRKVIKENKILQDACACESTLQLLCHAWMKRTMLMPYFLVEYYENILLTLCHNLVSEQTRIPENEIKYALETVFLQHCEAEISFLEKIAYQKLAKEEVEKSSTNINCFDHQLLLDEKLQFRDSTWAAFFTARYLYELFKKDNKVLNQLKEKMTANELTDPEWKNYINYILYFLAGLTASRHQKWGQYLVTNLVIEHYQADDKFFILFNVWREMKFDMRISDYFNQCLIREFSKFDDKQTQIDPNLDTFVSNFTGNHDIPIKKLLRIISSYPSICAKESKNKQQDEQSSKLVLENFKENKCQHSILENSKEELSEQQIKDENKQTSSVQGLAQASFLGRRHSAQQFEKKAEPKFVVTSSYKPCTIV